MENQNQARKANRTHDEIREALEKKKAYHYMHIEKIDKEIAALDEPRKPRQRKESVTSVIKSAQGDFSAEELRAILDRAREAKVRMGAE